MRWSEESVSPQWMCCYSSSSIGLRPPGRKLSVQFWDNSVGRLNRWNNIAFNAFDSVCVKCAYVQLRTMDHLARVAMKNAANCVKYGELQGFRNRNMSNAYCGSGIFLSEPRLSEGLLYHNEHLVVGWRLSRKGLANLSSITYWVPPQVTLVLPCCSRATVKQSTWLKSTRSVPSPGMELVLFLRQSFAFLPIAEGLDSIISISRFHGCKRVSTLLPFRTSDQARLPAKFKHII